jgi:hypothetical protein
MALLHQADGTRNDIIFRRLAKIGDMCKMIQHTIIKYRRNL